MPIVTFNIASSGHDGHLFRGGTAWPPNGGISSDTTSTVVAIERKGPPASSFLQVGIVRWDTSSIPVGATITAATLRMYLTSRVNPDSVSFTAEWYEAGTIGTEDYSDADPAPSTAHAGTAFSALTLNADNDFALVNPDANIAKGSGFTGLRLHSTGNASLTASNKIEFASFNHATLVEPRLLVDYEVATTTAYAARHMSGMAGAW